MTETNCGCDKFDHLEGAATQAYIARFLERIAADQEGHAVYYRCRVCGVSWKRIEEEGQRRPSLVRIATSYNV